MSLTEIAELEEVVLTPLKCENVQAKVVRIERLPGGVQDQDSVVHLAGGPYQGIVISKNTNEKPSVEKPEAAREFFAYVRGSGSDDGEIREKRQMLIWFLGQTDDITVQEKLTESFFRDVINPDNFPKDYVSFLKRLLNLVRAYKAISKIELTVQPAPLEHDEDDLVEISSSEIRNGHLTREREAAAAENGDVTGGGGGGANDVAPPKYVRRVVTTTVRQGPDETTRVDEERRETTDGATTVEIKRYSGDEYGNRSSVSSMDGNKRHSSAGPGIKSKSREAIQESRRIRILDSLQDAFPNAMRVDDICKLTGQTRGESELILKELASGGLVQEVEAGRWIRVTIDNTRGSPKRSSFTAYSPRSSTSPSSFAKKHDFQVVAHVPMLSDREQPTVAVITCLYWEKQAVDAMLDNKTTFVRYRTEGEGQVYTIGQVGRLRVVTTKLARRGSAQGMAQGVDRGVASGNTVTRLLGTFGKIEHVLLVGVAGGIPNPHDDSRHVRRGDVVVSWTRTAGDAVYVAVTDVDEDSSGSVNLATQSWAPKDKVISSLLRQFQQDKDGSAGTLLQSSWQRFITEGLADLQGEQVDFRRPPGETDRLFTLQSDSAWREVTHPAPASNSPRHQDPERPLCHYGCLGTGFHALVDGGIDRREEFALFNEVKALDTGCEAALESIEGNRKDSFVLVRGVADYMEGTAQDVTQDKAHAQWQSYAALTAAAYMKALLLQLQAQPGFLNDE